MIKKYIYNNIIFVFIFLFLRKIFSFFFKHKGFSKKDKVINSPEQISKIISNYIKSNKPFFVGRLGAHEINIIENYFGTKKKKFP